MKKKRLILTAVGAALLAVLVLVNSLIGLLPVCARRLDATTGSLTTPSQSLSDAAKAVSHPVTIYYVASEANTDTLLSTLVERARQENGLITVKRLVPGTAGDDVVSRYAPDGLSENSLIVVGPDRAYVIKNEDLIETQYNQAAYYYSGQYVVEGREYLADSLLSFALEYTTRDDLPVVYQLTGHGETALESLAADELARRYVALETLNLSQADGVPEDALALIVNAPTSDLTKEESDKLLSYLKTGGRLLLTTAYDKTCLQNLADVTAYYGLQAVSGLVQDPGKGRHYSDSNGTYNYYMKPILAETGALESLAQAGTTLCIAQSHALTAGAITRAGLTVQPLLTTSEEAYLKATLEGVTTLDQEEGDAAGEFTLAMSAEEGETRLVWIASGAALADSAAQISSGGNTAMFTALMNYLADLPEPAEQSAVNLMLTPLESQSAAAPVVKALLAALPLFALIIGLLATRRRK